MEEYTKVLNEFLNGKRDVKRKIYKVLGRGYRAVNSGIIDWDKFLRIFEIEEGVAV